MKNYWMVTPCCKMKFFASLSTWMHFTCKCGTVWSATFVSDEEHVE